MAALLLLALLLLAWAPAARPAPPTCYSRTLALSREVSGDFESLQAAEPREPCVRHLPRLYLDIHVRGRPAWVGGEAPCRDAGPGPCPSGYCASHEPPLLLQNYCVLAKLRDFVASPQCWRVAEVDALKDKARKLYTIMNSFCRRDLVFVSDDCSALEYPSPVATALPGHQS
ncbi:Cytokine-like protein 1 [Galemys pyrenaicus]|uniref:Cytokine-like protein 1 n=1 Tax=Galemys pyrenaicus TaxID=202257 RepID=A0A8J5ZGV2_GALPY|nr:Cytokine-like protein 1 [Galemys pyrenaicus]